MSARRAARLAARLRVPTVAVGVLLLVAGPLTGTSIAPLAGLVLLVAGLALYFRVGTVRAEPVVAPADGTVVRVHDRERDHRSRSSWPGLLMWIAEGLFRELTGPDRILGNHVVIEIAPGAYAVVAHLQRRSVKVKAGDRVRAGELLGACGNSGSSTEPHVHFQVMDRPRALLAAGLPFTLTGAADEAGRPAPLPATGDVILA